jgi:hypothetical protein
MNPYECLNRQKRATVLVVCLSFIVLTMDAASAADKSASRQPASDTEAAERALERTLVTTGALLLPKGLFEIEPSFFYVRNEQQGPVVFGSLIAEQHVNNNIVGAAVQLRAGLPGDAQVELNLPYSHVSEENVTEVGFQPVARTSVSRSGMDDVSLGVAKTLMVERDGRPNLIARLTWDSDSGKTDNNVSALSGSGFNEARISLVATRRQDPLVFLGGLSYQKAYEKNGVKPGDEVGITLGAILAASPATSLRLVLDQTFVDDLKTGGQTLNGSHAVVGALTFGASSTVGAGKFLDFTIQTGLTDAAADFAFGVSLTMRFGAPKY